MKKKKKEGIVRALSACKKYLHHSDRAGFTTDSFICNAIDTARERGDCFIEEANDAIQLIDDRLGNKKSDPIGLHLTVECWLLLIPEVKDYLDGNPDRFYIIQDYRHRWVDALIEEFSK